jgi:hypothetical protein
MSKSFYFTTFIMFCFIILFFILIYLFVLPPVIGDLGGDTGIKVMSQKCLGLQIPESDLIKIFSPGIWSRRILWTNFVYRVPQKSPVSANSGPDPIYCMGIDIWHNQ